MELKRFGFMVSREPVEDCFDYVLEHGIRHIEIDLKQKHSLLETFSEERVKRICGFCETNNISISLHPPYNMNLCSRLPMVRWNHTSYLMKCISLASQMGARHLTLHLGNFYRYAIWANPREHALERLLKLLLRLLPLCEQMDVCLALENMIPIPAEAGYSFLGDNVDDFVYIFSLLPSQKLKFCLDIGHANTAEGAPAYIEKLGEHLISVHFHDNRGKYDDHLNVGEGTVPWNTLLYGLNEIGFKGPYISECFKSLPHEAIQQLKQAM